MDNIFIIAFVISFIFTLIKILEMKYIDNQNKKPLKFIIRDSLLVYFSVLLSDFIIDQITPSIKKITYINTQPQVYLSEPLF
jgi:hypothetical protein